MRMSHTGYRDYLIFIKFLGTWDVNDKESYEMYNRFKKLKPSYRYIIISLIEKGATISEVQWKLKECALRQAFEGVKT
jgi:hypothetical protein